MKRRRRRRRRRKEEKIKKKHEEKKNTNKAKKNFLKKKTFKRRRSEKIGDTRIEYKRDVKHKKYQKHFRKSRVLFWGESQKNEIEYAKSKPKKFKKKRRNQKHWY